MQEVEYGATLFRTLECAMLLVKLGANFDKKLVLPPPPAPQMKESFMGLSGKIAQQLTQISQRTEPIKAMEEMQSPKEIALVYCRCGSRLPWNECHARVGVGEPPSFFREPDGRLLWQYSPLAPCTFHVLSKKHTTHIFGGGRPNRHTKTIVTALLLFEDLRARQDQC